MMRVKVLWACLTVALELSTASAESASIASSHGKGAKEVLKERSDEKYFQEYIRNFANSISGELLHEILRLDLRKPLRNVSPKPTPPNQPISPNWSNLLQLEPEGETIYSAPLWSLSTIAFVLITSLFFLYTSLFAPLHNSSISALAGRR